LKCPTCCYVFSSKQGKSNHVRRGTCQAIVVADNNNYVTAIAPSISQQTNNITNNGNGDINTGTVNNTVNININGIGQENLAHLKNFSDKEMQRFMTNCLKNGPTGLCQLLVKTHFDDEHPENQNLRKMNKKDDFLEYHNGESWELGLHEDVLEDVFKTFEVHFAEYVDSFYDKLAVHKKTILDRFMKKVGEPLEWDFTSNDYDYTFDDTMTEQDKQEKKNRIYNMAVEYIYRHSRHKKQGVPSQV
jgi:hypothetical protein